MVSFNLLPWREKQAKYELHVLMQMVTIVTIIMSCLLFGVDKYFLLQEQAVADHIAALKKELIWRQNLKRQAQMSSNLPPPNKLLDLFEFINEVDTHAVCFNQIKQQKNGIEFIGLANSPEQLTRFLQTSSLSSYFSEMKINQLRQQNNQLQFNLLGKTHVV